LPGIADGASRMSWLASRRAGRRAAVVDEPTVPPPLGVRHDLGVQLQLVIDDSGSTTSTDPAGNRYVAARRIVNLLGNGLASDGLDDRVGVVHFADKPGLVLRPTSVRHAPGRRRVLASLRARSHGGTAIVPAIRKAASGVDYRSEREPLVLVFTDGESGESSAELAAAVQELPPERVHVIVLGHDLPQQWHEVPLGSVTALADLTSADEIEWAMAKAVYEALGLGWTGGDGPPWKDGSPRR
jgi:hypothetical protein